MTNSRCSSPKGHLRPSGVTLAEILVVVVLATLVMGAGLLVWGRTSRTVVKGEEMMDLQLALRSINERIRSDVRTLVAVKSCSKDKVSFTARKKGKEIQVAYRFDEGARTLVRTADGAPESFFNAPGLVSSVEFRAQPSVEAFESLELTLELRSVEKRGNPGSRLAVVSQFSSRSREPPFEIVK